jgi:hypothetical protein
MAVDVVFEIPLSSLDDFLADVGKHPELEPEVQETAAASGGGDIATVLIVLAPPTIASLTTLATVWIKRGSTVEVGGQKVTGISRSVADHLARKLVDAHVANPAPPKDRGATPVHSEKPKPECKPKK